MDWSWNQHADKKFQFMDHLLVANVKSKKDKEAMEFFKLLSLCHTVMVDNKDGNSGDMPSVKCVMMTYTRTSLFKDIKPHLSSNGWTEMQNNMQIRTRGTEETVADTFCSCVQVNWCTRLHLLTRALW